MVEVALYLQEGTGELWSLATTEAWKSPLLTILPAGKLVLAVTYLREGRRELYIQISKQYTLYQQTGKKTEITVEDF